jgi:hypothetical protein
LRSNYGCDRYWKSSTNEPRERGAFRTGLVEEENSELELLEEAWTEEVRQEGETENPVEESCDRIRELETWLDRVSNLSVKTSEESSH